VQAIKSPTFIGFASVSAALTLYLYWTSGSEGIEKALLSVTAVCLEGLKLYSLLVGNIYGDYIKIIAKEQSIKPKELVKKDAIARSIKRSSRGMYAVYALAASVSIFGSFNFTVTAMDKTVRMSMATQNTLQSPEIIKLQSQITFYDKEIVRLQSQIDKNTADWKAQPPEYQSLKDRIQKKIDTDVALQTKYESSKDDDTLQLSLLQAEASSKTADIKKTSFQIIAEQLSSDKVKVTPQGILGVLLILTSLLIELGLIITSPREDTFGVFKKVADQLEEKQSLPSPSNAELFVVKEVIPESPKQKKKRKNNKKEFIEEVSPAVEKAIIKASRYMEDIQEPASLSDELTSTTTTAPKRVEVKESPIFQFLKNILPENGQTGFIRKENIISVPEVTPIKAREIFNNLARSKGPTGYPILEFRKEHGKWYSNYTLNEIIEMYPSYNTNTGNSTDAS